MRKWLMQSAICKLGTRGASGTVQCESEGLRTQGADGVSLSEGRRWGELSQLNSEAGKRANSSFLHLLFCSGTQWIRWCPPMWWRASALPSPLMQMLISSGDFSSGNTQQAHPEIMISKISGHPWSSQVDT